MVDAVEPGRLGVPGEPDDTEALPGGNVLALMAAALVAGWERGEWATYKQWASVGAQVRKGERGTACVFWNVTQDRKTVEDDETGEAVELMSFPRFRARAFTVFNAAQVDGYTPPPVVLNTEEQITHADAFLARVGAHVEHRCEGRAYCQPAADLIVLPPFETFSRTRRRERRPNAANEH